MLGGRGALSGVLDATVDEMKALGAFDIVAAIGPCIAQESYEVGAEFFEKFIAHNEKNSQFFLASEKEGHHMFDLSGYCKMRLEFCDIKQIISSNTDTYASEESYFSYRRTTHRGELDYGGQISVIMVT